MKQLSILVDDAQEIGAMSVQQDAMGISYREDYSELGLMAVLSDGIGGMQSGERFSAIATEEMLKVFAAGDPEADLGDRLQTAYDAARRRALALVEQEHVDGGATVSAVLVHRGRCAFLSVGDSPIYLLRRGGLIQLNREQTLGPLLDERAAFGLTLREEAQRNHYRAALLNNLCEREDMPCDRCPRPFVLRSGDKLALVSDGVSKTLDSREIEQALAMATPDAGGAHALIEAVRRKNKPRQDNYSAIVIDVQGKHRIRRGGGSK